MRVNAQNYNQQQLKDVIQTKWVIRSRPGGKTKRFKTRFAANGFNQKVNIDEIYAATPAAITLRILLTKHNSGITVSTCQTYNQNFPTHQYNQEPQYLSNHHQNVNKTTTYYAMETQQTT
eukprot:5535356-Amphidinium_carterae.1